MNELDPLVLLAVFQEMLGPLLWVLLAVIIIGTLAFLTLLLRERRLVAHRLMWSQAAGILGGALALVLMAYVSSSGFADAGGPIDWLLIALVFFLGLVGTAVLVYTVAGWCSICRCGRQTA
ncbi:DUF5368 domain-containing protein [Castellaniella sp.]|uniref:DUF5368 domain-containing protein n=1 Tax=Castellaniella sp. TaxID=1955812 RepID=UPI0035604C09